jgi:hypothetical protein
MPSPDRLKFINPRNWARRQASRTDAAIADRERRDTDQEINQLTGARVSRPPRHWARANSAATDAATADREGRDAARRPHRNFLPPRLWAMNNAPKTDAATKDRTSRDIAESAPKKPRRQTPRG